jgi:hypothetical protein
MKKFKILYVGLGLHKNVQTYSSVQTRINLTRANIIRINLTLANLIQ